MQTAPEVCVSSSVCTLVGDDMSVFIQGVRREGMCSILSQKSTAELTGPSEDSLSNTLPVSRDEITNKKQAQADHSSLDMEFKTWKLKLSLCPCASLFPFCRSRTSFPLGTHMCLRSMSCLAVQLTSAPTLSFILLSKCPLHHMKMSVLKPESHLP